MEQRQVRVGILADSLTQPAWVRCMLERILAEGHARFSVVVLNGSSEEGQGPPTGPIDRLRRYWKARDRLPYILFERFDRWKFRPERDAFESVDVSDLFEGIPTVEVSPRKTKFSDFIEGDDLDRVREADVDLFIRLGFRILRGGILTAAPAGVWSFHHGDNRVNRGGPAGVWEVFLGWPTTGSVLQILSEDLDGGLVLRRSWSSTHPLSPRLNRNNFYWKTVGLMPRALAELAQRGIDAFLEVHRAGQDPVDLYSNRLFLTPTGREMLGIWWRWIRRYVRRGVAAKLNQEQWQLRFSFRGGVVGSPWRYEKIVPPADRFWADPHLVERDGRFYAFIEEALGDRDGHIAVLELHEDGTHTTPTPVLEEAFHLSYPFVFEWEGELYMIPETGARRQVRLYRCERFPDSWTFDRVLLDGIHAVDATLFQRDSRWWMFAAVAEQPGASTHDELFLYSADSPVSQEWTPHPLNPIVSDVRRARPAGALFEHQGRIIRPAQDCSVCYGYGLRFMEVVELDEERYREREVASLTPDWERGLLGTHSVAVAGKLNVIDVKVRRSRFA